MPLPVNIDDLIHARTIENDRLEFKGVWDDHTEPRALRTISAFANDFLNSNGGYVIVGIDTDAEDRPVLPPRGIEGDFARLQNRVLGQCRTISPDYAPILSPERFQDRNILVIWCPAGDSRPYGLKGGSYWVRIGSQTREAKDDLRRQLFEQTARVPFDDRRCLGGRIEDVSPLLVRRFLSDVGSSVVRESGQSLGDLLRAMRMTVRVNAHLEPKNVALLFFHETPESFFPGARIEVAQFSDGAGDLMAERTIQGPLPDQLRTALEYLRSLIDVVTRKVPDQAEASRIVAYPYAAIEEALVNAVLHRSYEAPPEPTKVYIYPDRLEVISYPGPVAGITLEQLRSGRSVPPVAPRNRRVGELLKELRLAEQRGTGLLKIRRAMRDNGSADPEFDFDEDRTYFRVKLPAHAGYVVLHALQVGGRLWAEGDRDLALELLDEAQRRNPGSGVLTGQLIEYAHASRKGDIAKTAFERFEAVAAKTDPALAYLRYAAVLLEYEDLESARALLDAMPPPGSVSETLEAASLMARSGLFAKADQLFERASASQLKDPTYLQEFARAKMHLAQTAPPETQVALLRSAETLLRLALSASEPRRQAGAWFDLAQVLEARGATTFEIEKAFKTAIALRSDPGFISGYEFWKSKQSQGR